MMLQAGMTSHQLRNAIYEQMSSLQSGSLTFWGNWFGGRFDNIHRIVGADSLDDTAVIYFDHGESLIIKGPEDWSLERGHLLVHEAECVRFQWFYYGRLPSRETLHFEEYRRVDGHLTYLTDYPVGRSPALQETSPAVQLHSVP